MAGEGVHVFQRAMRALGERILNAGGPHRSVFFLAVDRNPDGKGCQSVIFCKGGKDDLAAVIAGLMDDDPGFGAAMFNRFAEYGSGQAEITRYSKGDTDAQHPQGRPPARDFSRNPEAGGRGNKK